MKRLLFFLFFISPYWLFAQKVNKDSLLRSKELGYQVGFFIGQLIPFLLLSGILIAFIVHRRRNSK